MQQLNTIDLGGTDAESDDKLENDFFETDDVSVVIDGREFVLLGRKGSGKSSLFRQVPRLVTSAPWAPLGVQVVNLSPDNYEWTRLTALEYPDMPKETLLTASWQISLYLQIADVVLNDKWSLRARRSRAEAKLRRSVIRVFGKPRVGESVFRRVVRILDSFSEGTISVAQGVTFSFKRRERVKASVQIIDLQKHLRALVEAAIPEDARILIQVDRLDDAWDGSQSTQLWLIGLLKAAKSINDAFRSANSSRIKVVIYLRTDIYETLRFDDKDKLRSFEKQILWAEESLKQLIEKRLPIGLTLEKLLESRPIDRNQYPLQYFFDHTFLRPREAIQFLQEALGRVHNGARFVPNATLREAEVVFSSWKVDDLKLEFDKANPELPELIEALRQGTHRYDSLPAIEDRLERAAPLAVKALGRRGALQLLFNTSVIGVRLNESGKVRYRVNEASMQLPNVGSVYVHPGLRKALLITEARAPRSKRQISAIKDVVKET